MRILIIQAGKEGVLYNPRVLVKSETVNLGQKADLRWSPVSVVPREKGLRCGHPIETPRGKEEGLPEGTCTPKNLTTPPLWDHLGGNRALTSTTTPGGKGGEGELPNIPLPTKRSVD